MSSVASSLRTQNLVIGSGPGGATTAHILAEAGKDVLVLEEGRDLPLESCTPFSTDEMAQKYRAGGLNVALGNAKVAFAEACTVGGGSEINAGLYHRTPADLLDQWQRSFQVQGTTFEDLQPHFAYSERALDVSTYPGLSPLSLPPLASRKLAEGADCMGWRSMEVPRWFSYQDGTHGTRRSMTKTLLPRAREAGAQLLVETRASGLKQNSNGWTVDALHKGRPLTIHADAVFVCAGALQTPLLLRRSGITRNVGNSLAMHPTAKVVALFDDEVNHEGLGVPVHQVKEFSPRISLGCSISSRAHLALAMAGHRCAPELVRNSWRRMAIYYAMITGPHTGTVRSVPGCTDPLIRYKVSPDDLRDLATGLRRLTQLLLASGAKTVYPSITGATPITSMDQLSTIPAALPANMSNLMTIHLFSSCPMGEDLARCAVNSMGRVHGVKNLSVHDASVIPTALGVNPQGTVMALARRNTMNFLGAL